MHSIRQLVALRRSKTRSPARVAHDVLERHVHDRHRDQRLDQRREPQRARREVEGRGDERDRMRDGERRDDEDERAEAPERNHQAEQKQQVIGAVEDVPKAEARRTAAAAWYQLGSSRTSPGSPVNSNARTAPPGGRKRSTVTTRTPSRASVGIDRERRRSDAIGYSRARRAAPGSRRSRVDGRAARRSSARRPPRTTRTIDRTAARRATR